MNYWLHRVSYKGHLAYPALDNNVLTIGWGEFANQDCLSLIQNNNPKGFSDYVNRMWGIRPRSRLSLWSFVRDMQKGDIVVVPRPGQFRIFKIVSDVQWTSDELKKENLGWERKVEPITGWLSRVKFADAALTRRMKYLGTTVHISDLKVNIERAIDGKPLSIYSDMVGQTIPSWMALIRKYNSPEKFERLIAWYFKRVGANEVTIPPKNSRGKIGDCDVEAVFESIRTIVSVQVKRHDGVTGTHSVNQITDYSSDADEKNEDSDYFRARWVVSSASDFSMEAKIKARANNVLLFNGEDFVQLLLTCGIDEGIDV